MICSSRVYVTKGLQDIIVPIEMFLTDLFAYWQIPNAMWWFYGFENGILGRLACLIVENDVKTNFYKCT